MASGDCKVYVGNLGDNTSKKELEDIFFKYGPITNIWVARNPPGFAFVQFEDPRDAKDAIRALDGTKCCGTKLIVEMSNGGRIGSTPRRRSPPPRRSRSKSPWRKGSGSRSRSRSRSLPRRSRSFSGDKSDRKDDGDSGRFREWDISCKVYVGNLLNNASKTELEDAFSKYGPIKNVWVARNPPGFAFIEYQDPRDAEDAVRGLDGMRCCGTRVIVEMSNGKSRRGGGGGSRRRSSPYSRRSRSKSPWRRSSRGRSRSRSPRSRSRSRSPFSRRDRSRSRSFSRDRR